MSMIGKDKLVFDTTATLTENDNTGAFLRSAAGTLLTHTTVGGVEALDVESTGTFVDDAAFTATTSRCTPIAGFFDDTATDSVDENDVGAIRMSGNRNLYTQIRDAAGNERGVNVTASNQLETVLTAALPAGAANIGNVDIESIVPVTSSGTLTAVSQSVTIDVGGYGSVGIQLSGTWTATVGFDATVDGTNWADLEVVPSNSGTAVTTSTANGVFYVDCGGLDQIRAFSDAFTSGTVNVNLQANIASGKTATPSGAGGTSSSFGSAFPASGTASGFSDGTNMQGARVHDLDSGGGTEYNLGVNLRVSASGGSLEADAGSGAVSAGTLRVTQATDVAVNVASLVADDAADSGNPIKVGARAVFGAALSAISTTNDRADLIADEYRRLYINDSPNISATCQAVSVTTTVGGTLLPATALVGRRRIIIQNLDNSSVFIGTSGSVTTANGLELAARGSLSLEIGEDITISGIVAAGTADVRVLELA